MRMGEYLSVTTVETGLILVTGDDVAIVAGLQKVVWSMCKVRNYLGMTGEAGMGALYSLDCCLLSGASASLGYCCSSP